MRIQWLLGLGLTLCVSLGIAAESMPKEAISPQNVLQNLKEGNQRFLNHEMLHRDFEKEILETKQQQFPTAVLLSCMDSRNVPSLTLDQGIGDVFSIKVAGNVLNDDNFASLEYGTAVVGAKLIVVMGHTRCGAVVSSCKNVQLGHITGLLNKIKPAVQTSKKADPKGACTDYAFVDHIAKQNVMDVIKEIPKRSPIIAKLMHDKKIEIVGAMYDVSTGKVDFF